MDKKNRQEGYDFYGDVQLKSGFGVNTEVGDKVPYGCNDGIYVGIGGVAVILNGILIATFDCLTNRFGEKVYINAINRRVII